MKKLIYIVPMKFTALNSNKFIKKGSTIHTFIGAYALEYDAMKAIIDRKGTDSKLDFDGTIYSWTDKDGDIDYAFEARIETTMLYE